MRFTILKIIIVSFFAVLLSLLILVFTSSTLDESIKYSKNELLAAQSSKRHSISNGDYKFTQDGTVNDATNETTALDITYILNPVNICDGFSESSDKLLILVESSATNFKRRRVIRDTWALRALQEALNYRVVFIISSNRSASVEKHVLNESWTFADIIQLRSTESYANLAIKSIAYLKWFPVFCKQTDFIFKTDDDIFIHIPNLRKILSSKLNKDDSDHILCHENKSRKIIRKNYLKSFSDEIKRKYAKYSVENIPGVYYPRYCAGFGYGFTAKVGAKLSAATNITPYFFLEDVYITGFCRTNARLHVMDTELLTLRPAVTAHAVCTFSDGRVNSQEMDINSIRNLWISLNSRGYVCPQLLGLFRKHIFRE